MTIVKARKEHEVVYQELVTLISRHAAEVSAAEILAIACNMVGKLMAMQDQRTMTKEAAINILKENIEMGNASVIEKLRAPSMGNA
jgi:hypothetical protein